MSPSKRRGRHFSNRSGQHHSNPISEQTQRHIDEAVRGIVMTGFSQATSILTANRTVLRRSAQALLEHETLDQAAILDLTKDLQRQAGESRPPGLGHQAMVVSGTASKRWSVKPAESGGEAGAT